MTNKELAVQLYIASLQANATITSSPQYKGGNVHTPTIEKMIKDIGDIAAQLSTIKDN